MIFSISHDITIDSGYKESILFSVLPKHLHRIHDKHGHPAVAHVHSEIIHKLAWMKHNPEHVSSRLDVCHPAVHTQPAVDMDISEWHADVQCIVKQYIV